MPIITTIVIPCRNEEKFIAKCLDSLEKQTFPKESTEVFVVDGMSDDQTRRIVAGYENLYPWIKMLDNPRIITPCAFNVGIKNARGKCVIIMGAHAEYPQDYIAKCVANLEATGADNVGGRSVTKPAIQTPVAKAIAFSFSSLFGARSSANLAGREPFETDTVFGGCYRKAVFEKIGLFNEDLAHSQDMDFNIRLKKSGGKIMMFPEVVSYYYPKSGFKEFWRHNIVDGIWAVYPMKFTKRPLKFRHYLPLFFVASIFILSVLSFFWRTFAIILAVEMALYILLNLRFAAGVAAREKNPIYLFLVPAAFTARYFASGIGSLYGLFKLILPAPGQAKNKNNGIV